MKKIPKKIKILSTLVSVLIFIYMNLNPFVLQTFFKRKIGEFDYYIGFSTNSFDYLLLSAIPIAAIILNSKRRNFSTKELIMDNVIIVISTLVVLEIGYYMLNFIGRPVNPLIPQYFVSEPFDGYSLLVIGGGICIPFLLRKANIYYNFKPKMRDEIINEIGTKNNVD